MQSKILPQVKSFLSQNPIPMFIGGKWVKTEKTFETFDPGTGKAIAIVSEGGEAECNRAVDAAAHAFKKTKWATMPVEERAKYLLKLADLIEKNKEVLAQLESMNVGKVLIFGESDIKAGAETLRYFANLAMHHPMRESIAAPQFDAYTVRQPYGPCAFIIPWNFPFLLAIWAIAPALATGNTVIIKPAENTPLSTLYLCKLVEEAAIPEGVINVVSGFGSTAGAALAKSPKIKRMSFTGSTQVGRLIASYCGANLVPVKLELGGKGAAVLLDDIDVEKVAKTLASIITCNTGQMCCTASRWLVHEKIHSKFVDCVLKHLKSTAIGYAFDEKAYMGPVVSEKQRSQILQYVERGERTGAKTLLKAKPVSIPGHEKGYYISAGLLEGSPENVCAQEEIFGPVSFVIPFKTEHEAIEIVHSTPYGLGNSVWSSDHKRAEKIAESLAAGINWINTHNAVPLGVPYGGYNLSGFGGGVNSVHTLLDYLRIVSIVKPSEAVITQGT